MRNFQTHFSGRNFQAPLNDMNTTHYKNTFGEAQKFVSFDLYRGQQGILEVDEARSNTMR